jgi:hypothetical protein
MDTALSARVHTNMDIEEKSMIPKRIFYVWGVGERKNAIFRFAFKPGAWRCRTKKS